MTALTSSFITGIPHPIADIADEIRRDFITFGYFDKYGGMCVTTAYLLKNIFCDRGFNAHVEICYMCVSSLDKELVVGYQSTSKDDYIDVHAICVVNNIALLDYATGAASEFFGKGFIKSFLVPYYPNPPFIARYSDEQYHVQWATDSRILNRLKLSKSRKKFDASRRAANLIFDEYKSFKRGNLNCSVTSCNAT